MDNILSLEEAMKTDAVSLANMSLFKSIGEDDEVWKFSGIASDESVDIEGDVILRKALDLSYAQERGFVNWDHSREPEHQLGYLTKAVVISKKGAEDLRKSGYPELADTASVYIEGALYKSNPKAESVYNLMKSTPEGVPGLGISLEGSVARDTKNGGIVKAYVRGVALTSQPVHPKTLVRLRKSIAAYNEMDDQNLTPDLPHQIATHVVEMMKSATADSSALLTRDQAVLFVLQQKPHWNYDVASRVVDYTMQKAKKE